MANPEPQTVMQDELRRITREARQAAGLTQEEAARRLDVAQSVVSRAENDPSGRFLRTQRRIIEELAGWGLEGPFWKVTRTENS